MKMSGGFALGAYVWWRSCFRRPLSSIGSGLLGRLATENVRGTSSWGVCEAVVLHQEATEPSRTNMVGVDIGFPCELVHGFK